MRRDDFDRKLFLLTITLEKTQLEIEALVRKFRRECDHSTYITYKGISTCANCEKTWKQ